MSETPILVLGGTGKTGRRVARQLVDRGRSEPRDFSAYVAATIPTGVWNP